MNAAGKIRELVMSLDILAPKRAAPEDVAMFILKHGPDIAAALEEWDFMRPQRAGDAQRKISGEFGVGVVQRARRLGFKVDGE